MTPPSRKRGRPATAGRNEELREALILAAIDCFGARGFDGASLAQIAGQAGTDVALTRYYFGSKEDLWVAAVSHISEVADRELQNVIRKPCESASEKLKAVIRWFVDMSARYPQLSRIIVLDGDKSDARGQFIAESVVGPFYKVLAKLIAAAKREGCMPDVATRTIFFMITHGGSFPMAIPALTNAFPGGEINSARALGAHADAVIALVMKERG